MFRKLQNLLKSSRDKSLAEAFSRLGWIGFWMQIAIGAIPLALIIYARVFGSEGGSGTRGRLALIEHVTIGGLLVLAFTTVWFYRYTRLAVRIAHAEHRPPALFVQRAAWTGVAASTLGIVFS